MKKYLKAFLKSKYFNWVFGLFAVFIVAGIFRYDYYLKSTTLTVEYFDTKELALEKAKLVADEIDGLYSKSTGASNSFEFEHKERYIVYKKVPYDTLKARDFIVYRSDSGGLINHPLSYYEKGYGWKAHGDGNKYQDSGWVTEKNYIGKVIQPAFSWKDSER